MNNFPPFFDSFYYSKHPETGEQTNFCDTCNKAFIFPYSARACFLAHKHKMTEKQARGLKLQMLGELVICNHCQEKVHKKHYNQHLVSFHSDVEKTVECQVCSWRFISGWCDLTSFYLKIVFLIFI